MIMSRSVRHIYDVMILTLKVTIVDKKVEIKSREKIPHTHILLLQSPAIQFIMLW